MLTPPVPDCCFTSLLLEETLTIHFSSTLNPLDGRYMLKQPKMLQNVMFSLQREGPGRGFADALCFRQCFQRPGGEEG